MRSVRFKETPPNIDKLHVPLTSYREKCDDTLGEGPFPQRGTPDGFLMTGNYRPQAARNLVLLGGSFVESIYASERQRFPSIIERTLTDDWQVLNGGYSGMNTLHMLPILSTKIPTVMTLGSKLVLFIGQSDTSAMYEEGLYWARTKTVTPIQPATLRPYAPWGAEEAAVRVIDALLSTADAFGFDYGVVASPYRDADFANDAVLRTLYRRDRTKYELITGQRRFLLDAARAAAQRHDRPFFEGQNYVEPQHFYDSMHLNEHGHKVFSEAIGHWLTDWICR